MLPEISARRSLLEPSFRYLSPGCEVEKCQPLGHSIQIPFIHSDRFVTCSNFYIYIYIYIYNNLPVISSTWDAQVCINDNCACALAETLKLRFRAIFKVTIFFQGYMLLRVDTTFAQSLNVSKQIEIFKRKG